MTEPSDIPNDDGNELRRLRQEVNRAIDNLVSFALHAGQRVGVRVERERLMRVIQGDALMAASSATTRPPAVPRKPSPGYGAVAVPVRDALRTIGNTNDGVGPQELADYINQLPNATVFTVEQVRSALKVIAKRDEAIRVTRGRYRAGPALLPSLLAQPIAEQGLIHREELKDEPGVNGPTSAG